MATNEKLRKFIAEAFIEELDVEVDIQFDQALSREHLQFIRRVCAVKYMASIGVNISLIRAEDYVETERWKTIWEEVWAITPSPGESVFFFSFFKPI